MKMNVEPIKKWWGNLTESNKWQIVAAAEFAVIALLVLFK